MMRTLALAAAGLAGLTTLASAADLPSRAAPAPFISAPVITWNGFYVGVNAGYGFSTNQHNTFCIAPGGVVSGAGCTLLPNLNTDGDGFVGGGQLGYNLQIGGFVAGFETDIQYTDLGRTTTVSGTFPTAGAAAGTFVTAFTARQQLDFLGTVRARLGFAMDRLLVYVTGGLAYGDVTTSQTVVFPAGPVYFAGRSAIEIGYAAGGGLEYLFTPNLSGKAEALYYDLGRRTVASDPGTGFTRGARFDTEGVIARAGLNYKFDLF